MKKFKIGIQLYSLREEMEKDVEGTLKTVSEMGYEYVEFAGYFGKSAQEIKALLDKYNLEAISVHQGYEAFLEKPEESIEYLKTLGVAQCAIPWMGREKHAGTDAFSKTVTEIKTVGKALRENGICLAYHNHDFEFEKHEGKYLLDWLYEEIPSDLLKVQLDTCWVKYAGADPVEYIKKYRGREKTLHLKDFVCKKLANGTPYKLIDADGKDIQSDSSDDNGFELRPVGDGIQNFEAILKAAEEAQIDYLIVEQDAWPTATAIESAKRSREYLKTLGQ